MEISEIVSILKCFDVTTLVAIAAMFWMFNKHVNKKFESLNEKFDRRFDKLSEDVKDIDRRLCRIEGSMASKECCMLKEEKQARNAQ